MAEIGIKEFIESCSMLLLINSPPSGKIYSYLYIMPHHFYALQTYLPSRN